MAFLAITEPDNIPHPLLPTTGLSVNIEISRYHLGPDKGIRQKMATPLVKDTARRRNVTSLDHSYTVLLLPVKDWAP